MTKRLSDFSDAVSDIGINNYGDKIERGSYSIISKYIPNYEEFWKNIVLPFRTTNPDKDPILLDEKLPRDHETVCIYSYSLFRTFLRTYKNTEKLKLEYDLSNDVSTDLFNDCVLYMSIGYNQIDLLKIAILLTFLGEKHNFNLDIEELSKLYKHRNKRSELERYRKKCEGVYGDILMENILDSNGNINQIRNFIVHGPKFAGFESKIPKPENVKKLIQWSDFRDNINEDPDDSEKLLIRRNQYIDETAINFFKLIDEFWGSALRKIEKTNPQFEQDCINPLFLATNDALSTKIEYDEFLNAHSYFPVTGSGSLGRNDSDSTSGDTITSR